jgi:proteasome lid subunit RPN8/RPN11
MINIEQEAETRIIQDALDAFPNECCGFLFGTEQPDGSRLIRSALPVDNSKEGDKTRRFEISPLDYLKAEKIAESGDLLLLGIYHSHPKHPAIPSEHDRKAAQPFFSYVIVSVYDAAHHSIRSWRLNDQELFEEETILSNTFQKQ